MADQNAAAVDNSQAQQFQIRIGDDVAFSEYRLVQGGIMFTHTEVPESLGGRGLGKALVLAGLKAARDRRLQVLPVCTFFANYMKSHPETHDLLHPDYRTVLGV